MPHAELLDLQPLPVSSLHDKKAEELYKNDGIKAFNPIQTQVIPAFVSSFLIQTTLSSRRKGLVWLSSNLGSYYESMSCNMKYMPLQF